MELQQILDDLETYNQSRKFRSFFNQPDRVMLSTDESEQKTFNYNSTGFSAIDFTLDRPCLEVKSIQLIHMNIPLGTSLSFNDYELIFPYYKLRTQLNSTGEYTYYPEPPGINNLKFIRLLPSYYPKNLIPNGGLYGYNKTFNNYQELSDELVKACANDLILAGTPNSAFTPNDISITYDETLNKFVFKGNNINTPWAQEWTDDQIYYVNSIVKYETFYFIAIEQVPAGIIPTNIVYWEAYVVNSSTVWNTYLVAGYNDPSLKLLLESVHTQSRTHDFRYSQYVFGVDGKKPDIYGIPPQPVLFDNPVYTLARRLGFNWNGIYNYNLQGQTALVIGNNNSLITTAASQIYNRLVPVPTYEEIAPDVEAVVGLVELPSPNAFNTNIYIAEGFCNLVLTSVLYLYGNFTNSSTLMASNTDASLISILPVNCGPLGIGYAQEALDNPLHKVNDTIQDIQLEFRNDQNQPFFVANNGIITFIFKLIY